MPDLENAVAKNFYFTPFNGNSIVSNKNFNPELSLTHVINEVIPSREFVRVADFSWNIWVKE